MSHYSGVTTRPQWYWDPNRTVIAIGSSSPNRPPHLTPGGPGKSSFPPVKKSAAELRCQDMIKVHDAEVRRNRKAEASLRKQAEEHDRASKRLRAERDKLRAECDRLGTSNKRLTEQLRATQARTAAQAGTEAPGNKLRKRVLDLIRRTHPDRSARPLDRTQLTQKLNDLLECV